MAWTRRPGCITGSWGDVSGWLRRCVKDQELTDQVKVLEKQVPDDADASRKAVRELIERKYTLPAESVRPQ